MTANDIKIRPVTELDITAISKIDERVSGRYRPEEWETRVAYYLRRDPECSQVAEAGGRVVGFMLGEIRSGEFGIEGPTGWIEVMGVDPDYRRRAVGRKLAEALLGYFAAEGASSVRTLVDTDMQGIEQFFSALGFQAGAVTLLEKPL